ncbi:MAG TPA: cobaltochelatase subunit CobN [Candidatus Baltobacteraceae bacterium]|nr:cobaltochelatase subunit CobN [Candidatus Baltobacteraceae bacterium]
MSGGTASQDTARTFVAPSLARRLAPVIAFISAVETDLAAARTGAALLPPDFPPVVVLAARDLPAEEDIRQALDGIRAVIVRILGGRAYFEHGFAVLIALARERGLAILAIPGDAHADPMLDALSTVSPDVLQRTYAYAFAGGGANLAQLFRYVTDTQLGTTFGFAAPEETPEWGFYHPSAPDPADCARLDRDTFALKYGRGGARGVVGILFYRADWASGNLAHVDALVSACEALALDVLPVFVYSLRDCERIGDLPLVYAKAFMREGKACVDAVISLLSYATSNLERGERAARSTGPALRADVSLDVPLIQGVTSTQTVDAWRENLAGLGPLDAATKIVMPEFDGKIIGPLFSFRDPVTSLAQAEPKQTEALARLAARHVRLRRIPNSEKRVVVMLTNFANRQGRVGSAVGLDTPASVVAILRALQADGYDVGEIPADGDALMTELLARGGYDTETLTQEQLTHADARYDSDAYGAWYAAFPARVRDELAANWGPAPGNAYRVDDTVYVAGIRLGNVFVMIQPPRGFGENPLGVYHSADLVPTHQYLGAYRWLRDIFGADAIIQCGKHGTLEWLPGKGLGLSEACYPALALGDVPLFYPFIIDDPGEGMQAKRRAHACILDHLIPPMTKAETYDELAKLQRLLGEYAAAERIDPEKIPLIADAIWRSVVAANLQQDLGIQALPDGEDFGAFLQHIDGYLCELGDLQIRDGLHVFGEPPTGSRLVDLSLALVRLDTPEALGTLHALADDLGISYEAISDPARGGLPYEGPLPIGFACGERDLGDTRPPTIREVRETLNEIAHSVVSTMTTPFDSAVLRSHGLPTDGAFERTVDLLTRRIIPDVLRTTDEMTNLLAGLRGRHVPPGPSGPPTRGMANVLPTGRNFYAIDVRAIPSRFAWTVGVRLGDALLQTAKERDGAFPRSIGMTVWGTANMRTQGDDIAEILWLLGVRPKWHEENGRIINLEIIPLTDLGRPRIDVTVRISGFFRDTFPGVVALLDRAVALVADAPESDDENYVRAATRNDERIFTAAGTPPAEARRRARFRIFGNKPGAYGTGILRLIADGTWIEERDLAESYLASGGFAFGAQTYGEPAPAEFRGRLAASTIAVQNQDNREHDLFDSGEYLQHHGGMIAAIRELRGVAPSSLFGDSSNPDVPKVRTLADEARRVFRARVVNPKWIAGMRRHGYKGALEMAATVDYLFGYDATAGVVEDWMYEHVARTYVLDAENRAFLESSNPWSAREMTERLLEAAQRGLWTEPDAKTLESLRDELLSIEGSLEDRTEALVV